MKKGKERAVDVIARVSAIAVILLIWYGCSAGGVVPKYMLPTPVDVIRAFVENFDVLLEQSAVTLQEAVYGLAIGIVIAFIMAVLMDRFHFLYKAFYPVIVISQTIPTIAIAPLLVLWMGFGMAPKITLVVITTFFPITIGLLDGYKNIDSDAVNLLRAMGAGKMKIFKYVKFPGALEPFFSSLKVSASYSVVGAVVSEWLGGFEGLGVYMTRVRKAYAFDKMFAVIIFISLVSLFLMFVVSIIEKVSMPWKRKTARTSE